MRASAAVLLSLSASALGYLVVVPNPSQGWTNDGSQLVVWERVETDPTSFTVVLTNTDRSVQPINNQVLAAKVDGTLKNMTVNPPSGGWPVGRTFRVNFVNNTEDLNTIFAQSDEFEIKRANTTSSTATTRPATSVITGTALGGSNSPSATNSGDAPSGTNGALASSYASTGLLGLGLCAFMGVLLA
ncbi:hypothetical protein AMATHDRAFT_3034 [Amanita thiersii Skay4041]|uniref:Yeast cell wall synthesis Kre9/Knh1-like N-terminal domain-containing protein n=1 Tax=Amanita thiersii Skay4041 TaxID=703135 RepID=A0A2A9NMQ2_9AGAR|nr:hypothetical protein AMATHDRAFT_3034 [Amanita thiersii Skay4041]